MLGAAAWRSAAAAPAALLASAVALAGVLLWPRSALNPDGTGLFAFSALACTAAGAPAGLRLWRGRALALNAAGMYALAAAATPLLGLVLVWARVEAFERSFAFALAALLLGAGLAAATRRFEEIPQAERSPASNLAVGTFATAGVAALALAFAMTLERGYLAVAFAATALGASHFAVARRIPLLRSVAAAIGFLVLLRLLWDPRIFGENLGRWPILNGLLLGYGGCAAAFLAAGHILKREREDVPARLCDALGVLFAALLVFFEIRHALNDGDPLAPTTGHVEQGLFALLGSGFAALLIRLDLARANPVFRHASSLFALLSALVATWGLALLENPLFDAEAVRGPVLLSTLLLGYLLPAGAAVVLARTARGVRPDGYVTCVSLLALVLVFGYVTLEVRHAFQGAFLTIEQGAGAAEISAYSAAWLALGIAFLAYGIWRRSSEARLASLALVVVSVVKVFLYDLTGIGGFWRAFSVICLGAVLIGIGLVYQRLVFAHPPARREPGAS
jgi:uncharacterized membrane protein